MVKKGDPCRVRLRTGEVVDAVFSSPMDDPKHNFVRINGRLFVAGRFGDCYFVGPACVLEPIGESK